MWEIFCQQEKIGEGFDSGRQSVFNAWTAGHQDFLH